MLEKFFRGDCRVPIFIGQPLSDPQQYSQPRHPTSERILFIFSPSLSFSLPLFLSPSLSLPPPFLFTMLLDAVAVGVPHLLLLLLLPPVLEPQLGGGDLLRPDPELDLLRAVGEEAPGVDVSHHVAGQRGG